MLSNLIKNFQSLLGKNVREIKESPENELPVFLPMPKVYPRIKHVCFAKSLDKIADMPDEAKAITEPLVGDLLLSYAIDDGDNFVFVSQQMLNKHATNKEQLRPMAEDNALYAMREIRKHEGLVNKLTTIDSFIACTILYPALWRQLSREVGGELIVAFPDRENVLYVNADDQEAVIELKRMLREDYDFNQTHALSRLLYQMVDDQWQLINR